MAIQIISLLIVAVIVIYFLNKEKPKEDDYFGKKRKLTKKENKILEYYKSIYTPIADDKRLPTIKRDGFELEDIALTATQIIYNNPIPKQEDIDKVDKGDLVKLLFIDKDGNAERMWVEYIEKEKELHKGILRNDAYEIDKLNEGEIIYFHSNHIYEIDKE